MSEYIVNLLPVLEEEKAPFLDAAPGVRQIFAGRRTVTPQQLSQATIVLGWPRPAMLARCPNLKWLHSMWAGTDEYTAPGVLSPQVLLTSSAGTNSQSVAEHMLACLLALQRKLPQCRDHQREGAWVDVGDMKTISGAAVLVVGAGNVGAAFASRCKALGAGSTIGLKRTVGAPVPGFDRLFPIDQLDRLLPQADVVALTLPHTPDTARLMDGRRLALMKGDAILLSAGRGSVLDQDALAAQMLDGRLWGAALDVTEPEPLPPGHPLWSIPNLLLTPHVAGGMRLEITRQNCVKLGLDNLRRYLAAEPLLNVVRR